MTLAVALVQALLAQLDEVVEASRPSGTGNCGQQDPAELDLDVAALGDLERARSASSWPGKSAAISAGVLKKNWSVSNLQWFGFLSESPDWMQSSASCARASSCRR